MAQEQTKFNPAAIDWERLKKFGIDEETLKKRKILPDLLNGYKSKVHIYLNYKDKGIKIHGPTIGKLMYENGDLMLDLSTPYPRPKLEGNYFGHYFTREEKDNLINDKNMGKAVHLNIPGQGYVESLVSVDPLTNAVYHCPVDSIYFKEEYNGYHLSDYEKEHLRQGGKIEVSSLLHQDGYEFDATLQASAVKRGVEYIFPERDYTNIQSIQNVQLSPQQIEDLLNYKAILVTGIESKFSDTTYDKFYKLDPTDGKLKHYNYNPDTPKEDREIIIPRNINGVELTTQEQRILATGEAIFTSNENSKPWVRLDLETGNIERSSTQNFDNEEKKQEIKSEYWGHKLSPQEMADLRKGDAVEAKDLVLNGKPTSGFLHINKYSGEMELLQYDPNKKEAITNRTLRSPGTLKASRTGETEPTNQSQDNSKVEKLKEKIDNAGSTQKNTTGKRVRNK